MSLQMGSTLHGKNLLIEEKILTFKTGPLYRKEAKRKGKKGRKNNALCFEKCNASETFNRIKLNTVFHLCWVVNLVTRY